jgi:glutathione S-transferase
MSAFLELPAFTPLVVFAVLLVLKMGIVAGATAIARSRAKVVLNPEDTKVNPGSRAANEEAPSVLRAKRAHQNDVENIPGFLVLALLFTLTGCSETSGWIYFGVYFAARTLHSIFYLNGVQPWRTAAFFVGLLTQLGVMVRLLMAVF